MTSFAHLILLCMWNVFGPDDKSLLKYQHKFLDQVIAQNKWLLRIWK
jgi:hypothetical protein